MAPRFSKMRTCATPSCACSARVRLCQVVDDGRHLVVGEVGHGPGGIVVVADDLGRPERAARPVDVVGGLRLRCVGREDREVVGEDVDAPVVRIGPVQPRAREAPARCRPGTGGSTGATISPIQGRASRWDVKRTHWPRNGCQRSSQVTTDRNPAQDRASISTCCGSHPSARGAERDPPLAGRPDDGQGAPVEGGAARSREAFLGGGVRAAQGLEHAGPVDLHVDAPVAQHVERAVAVHQAEGDEGQVFGVGRDDRAIEVGVEHHLLVGGADGRATDFGSVAPGDGLEQARFVRGLEHRPVAVRCAAGLPAHRAAVHEQLDLVGVGVDLHRHRRALVPGPTPARHHVAPGPRRAGAGLAVMLGSLHGEVRVRPQSEDDLAVERLGAPVAGDVDVATPGGPPRILAEERLDAESSNPAARRRCGRSRPRRGSPSRSR